MPVFTDRLRKAGAVSLVAASALGIFAGHASAQSMDYTNAANSAINWMKSQQAADGSFAGFGAGSTVDAGLALVASGQSMDAFTKGSNTPITFLEANASALAKTPGGAGKLLILVEALHRSPQFGGVDLVNSINSTYNAKTGQYGQDVIGDAFAVLGLDAAGQQVPTAARDFLLNAKTPEGGWAYSGDTKAGAADTNTTAVVVQALISLNGPAAIGPNDNTLQQAVAYLAGQQNSDGGFAYQKNDPQNNESDVDSSSYVAQALNAAGDVKHADQALAFIASLQKSNGAFQWKKSEPDDNAGATYQAVPALIGATLAHPFGQITGTPVTAPPPVPGMPTTGNANTDPVPALAAIAALLLGGGVVLRRKMAR